MKNASTNKSKIFFQSSGKKFLLLGIMIVFSGACFSQNVSVDPLITEALAERKENQEFFDVTKSKAEAGDARAQALLANCYFTGWCGSRQIQRNSSDAVRWAKKSDEQRDEYGSYLMGIIYREGFGVAQNYSKALEFFKASAQKKFSAAIYQLRDEYKVGIIVNQDYFKSYIWASVAATLADPNLAANYKYSMDASAASTRDEIAKNLNRNDLLKAQVIVEKCINSNVAYCTD